MYNVSLMTANRISLSMVRCVGVTSAIPIYVYQRRQKCQRNVGDHCGRETAPIFVSLWCRHKCQCKTNDNSATSMGSYWCHNGDNSGNGATAECHCKVSNTVVGVTLAATVSMYQCRLQRQSNCYHSSVFVKVASLMSS